MIHEEIKCPYCRVGFGGYKMNDGKISHLDVMWTSEAGLILDCRDSVLLKEHIISHDDRDNIKFDEDFQVKLNELATFNSKTPTDFSKETVTLDEFETLAGYIVRWGDMGEDQEFDDTITYAHLEADYNSGKNLYESLLQYLK